MHVGGDLSVPCNVCVYVFNYSQIAAVDVCVFLYIVFKCTICWELRDLNMYCNPNIGAWSVHNDK